MRVCFAPNEPVCRTCVSHFVLRPVPLQHHKIGVDTRTPQGNALFAYLLEIGDIQDFMQFIYWLVVSLGLALNVFRIYMVSSAIHRWSCLIVCVRGLSSRRLARTHTAHLIRSPPTAKRQALPNLSHDSPQRLPHHQTL